MEDPFDVLGLTPSLDLDAKTLEQRYRDLQRALHPDRFTQAPPAERRASLARAVSVNDAYRQLRDPLARAEALFVRRGGDLREDARRTADATLLMEIMELREQLETTRHGGSEARARLRELVSKKELAGYDELRDAFAALEQGARGSLELAGATLSRLRYYRRFLDEVAALDDQQLG